MCCGWLQVWQLELYTGCLLSLVEAVVYPPLFWLGSLDHSKIWILRASDWLRSRGSCQKNRRTISCVYVHVPPGCPPTGGSLDPLYVRCLW